MGQSLFGHAAVASGVAACLYLFSDKQRPRECPWSGLQPLSLRAYASMLLHFVGWWSKQPSADVTRFEAQQFSESTLVDYVRDQLNEHPKPPAQNINQRADHRYSLRPYLSADKQRPR